MNRIESHLQNLTCKIAGIRPESEGIKWHGVAVMTLAAKADILINKPVFEGDILPQKGSALVVVGPHSSWLDILRGITLGQICHRIIRAYAKHTLLDPNAGEPKKVKEQIEQPSDLLNTDKGSNHWKSKIAEVHKPILAFFWEKAGKYMMASVLNGVEAIPVFREGNDEQVLDFMDRGEAEFKKKHLVGILPQGHRYKDRKLAGPKEGAATLAMEYSHIPIYAVFMGRKIVITKRLGSVDNLLDDPQTSTLAQTNLTVLIFDAIADMSDPEIRDDWYRNQRPTLLPPSYKDSKSL